MNAAWCDCEFEGCAGLGVRDCAGRSDACCFAAWMLEDAESTLEGLRVMLPANWPDDKREPLETAERAQAQAVEALREFIRRLQEPRLVTNPERGGSQ